MPEGHTIHRMARDQRRDLAGRPVAASSPQGRFAAGAAAIDGRVLVTTEARGKHLFHRYEPDLTLYVHLGLIGKFRRGAGAPGPPTGAIRLRLRGAGAWWDLAGPMRCDLVEPTEHHALIADLGPDPLRRDGRVDEFVHRLSGKRTDIAAALLDQSVIAGLGNVYRSELLFLAGLHPSTTASSVTGDEARSLWALAVGHLRIGVRLSRIVTVDVADSGRAPGRVPAGGRLYVYQRAGEPCRRCSTPIERSVSAARKIWWCPICQPA